MSIAREARAVNARAWRLRALPRARREPRDGIAIRSAAGAGGPSPTPIPSTFRRSKLAGLYEAGCFGSVAQSDVLSVTTPAPTNDVAPTAPTNVQLGFQSGNGEAWLSWDRSTDDADPQHLIVYEIYFNGVPNNLENIIGGNSTIAYCTVQGTGLNEVVLRAVDTSGNRSAPSSAVWVDC